jgi:protein SCO1/2
MRRWLLIGLLVVAGAAPPDLSLFAYRQQAGSRLPLQSLLREADDRPVRVGELSHGLPLILVLGYFHCPNLCGLTRQDLFSALGATGLQAGRDYALALVSIDPGETARDASAARAQDLADNGATPGASLQYLTGSAGDVQAVADAVGFRDRLDPQTKQFIHPAGIVFATPNGVVSSYLLGLGYTPTDIRTALYRAGAGGIAEAGSPVLLICFHFDPTTGRYTLAIEKLLRLAAVLTVVTVAGTMALLFRRERRRI